MRIRALSLAIIAGLSFGPVASRAQFALLTPTPTPTPTPPPSESIIVVGENLPGGEENGPDPIITIDRDQIDQAGERTLADLLRDTTVSGANGVPTSNNGIGYTPGASSISLRGFDPGETLVLVDGKRVGNYPVAVGTQTFVDLNSISASTVSQVEIVTDSASAEYGADAVAGVVNIKLRHDYRGAETDVEYGNTLEKDSGEFSAALLFGVGDKNTDVSGALNYYQRNSILASDRAYSAVTFHPSANTSPANLELSRAAVVAAGGDPALDLDDFIGRPPLFNQGDAPASSYSYQAGHTRNFNFNAYATAFPDSERYGGFVNASHRIFGEQMVLSADFNYQDAQTRYDLAAAATSAFQTPGFPTLAIPPHTPGATLGGPSYADTGVSLGAFNPFNPFQQIISGSSEARLFDFGDREIDAETKAWFTTVDLKGDKLFDGNWSYDLGFRDSEVGNTSSGTNVSASRFDRVLNAADPIFDPASKQYIGTTIPYDPFGDFRVPIASNAPSIAFATIHPVESDFSNQIEADLDFRTSELLRLPAGGIALGFGLQFRRESIKQEPDKFLEEGDMIGNPANTFIEAGRNAAAAYAQLSVPVFAPSFNFAGLRALDFTAAFRFEEFADDANNAVVPKLGLRWQPFDPWLTIRATWGEGFYEPTLFELYGNPVSGLAELFDPVKNATVYDIPTLLRSNPALQPGDSRNFSSGIVFKPRFAHGLTISADIFEIEGFGRVNAPDLDDVVQRAALGRSAPGEEVFRDASGDIQLVQFAYQNGGSEKASGVDFALQYQLATSCGTITSLTRASFLNSFLFAGLPGDREMDLTHAADNSADPYLQWRATSQLEWSWRNFDATLTCHYFDGFREMVDLTPFSGTPYAGRTGEHWVAARALFDLQISYRFAFAIPREDRPVPGYSRPATDNADDAKSAPAEIDSAAINTSAQSSLWKRLLNGTTLTFGANNLLGQDPPIAFSDGGSVNYPDNIYDSTGRFLYASIKKKF